MPQWLKELDELLRGNKTKPESLAEGTGHLRLGLYAFSGILLGLIYGACMGLYSVLSRTPPVYDQLLASTVKVPLLFFLTLVVTLPSLYVFSALMGSRLTLADALRVIVASITVNLAVLASFGPITAFFTFTTTSYHFMKLLSVFFFVMSGMIGLGFLLKMLQRLESPGGGEAAAEGARSAVGQEAGAVDAGLVFRAEEKRNVGRRLFKVWIILYAVVGAQMGWILRPLIGTPDLPFTWFRQRGGNVFLDVLQTVKELFGS